MTTSSHPAVHAAVTKKLSIDDLEPADILLSKGHGFVSDLIAESDGGQYSHGALWSGMGIIQATGQGITESEIEGTHAVYRYPGLPEKAAQEIVNLAAAQVKGKYAYGELVMLGALFLSGIRVQGAVLNRLLEAIGGPTATKLQDWLNAHADKGARVCTELVASAYYDAAKQKYALKVRSRNGAHAPVQAATPPTTRSGSVITHGLAPAVDDPELQPKAVEAARNCIGLLTQNNAAPPEGTRKFLVGDIAVDAETGKPIGVVTPADLEFSPSLRLIGCLNA